MKFFEKLKGKYDLARWALKRAREAEAQVDELLQLSEIKDARIKEQETEYQHLVRAYCRANEEVGEAKRIIERRDKQMKCVAEAYARLKVDADVMRMEITQYREIIRNTAEDAMRRGVCVARKEQDNAGNDRGE
jgi:hypothetical protein